METQTEPKALPPDPVIDWLEGIKRYCGGDVSELAQRAIDRLTRADEPTVDEVITQLLEDLGTWRVSLAGGRYGAVVSDRPLHPHHGRTATPDVAYYGGHLVAESMSVKVRIAVARVPQLLAAARETATGRAILAQIAQDLLRPDVPTPPVDSKMDGIARLADLAEAFNKGDRDGMAEILRTLATVYDLGHHPDLAVVIRHFVERSA
jgi:hypothetical protein